MVDMVQAVVRSVAVDLANELIVTLQTSSVLPRWRCFLWVLVRAGPVTGLAACWQKACQQLDGRVSTPVSVSTALEISVSASLEVSQSVSQADSIANDCVGMRDAQRE